MVKDSILDSIKKQIYCNCIGESDWCFKFNEIKCLLQ